MQILKMMCNLRIINSGFLIAIPKKSCNFTCLWNYISHKKTALKIAMNRKLCLLQHFSNIFYPLYKTFLFHFINVSALFFSIKEIYIFTFNFLSLHLRMHFLPYILGLLPLYLCSFYLPLSSFIFFFETFPKRNCLHNQACRFFITLKFAK